MRDHTLKLVARQPLNRAAGHTNHSVVDREPCREGIDPFFFI